MKHLCKTVLICSAGLALVGCRSEIEGGTPEPVLRGDGDITFLVGENAATKSGNAAVKAVAGDLIPFDEVDGTTLYLEESVLNLDALIGAAPATKGLPIYTENFGEEHESFGAKVYSYGTATATSDVKAVTGLTEYKGGSNKFNLAGSADKWPLQYKYSFTEGLWPDSIKDDNLLFFLSAPDQVAGLNSGVTAISYHYTSNTGDSDKYKGVIKFSYTSPAAAGDQKDILFTTKSFDRASYNAAFVDNGKHDGASILFYHTLAGVKFQAGNIGDGVTITKIELHGIKSKGNCTVKPMYEDDGYELTSTNYSNLAGTDGKTKTARSKAVSIWDSPSDTTTFTLSNPAINSASDGMFPDSFYGDKTTNNLGENNYMDADFKNVFYFIPQDLETGAKITITYKIKVGDKSPVEHTKTIPFSGRKWYAGELYTYRITAKELGVFIKDSMDDSHAVKSGIKITNTHNTTSYIRVAVIGNWFDSHEAKETVLSPGHVVVNHTWDQDDAGEDLKSIDFNNTYWFNAGDGFWYYMYPVKGGVTIPEARTIFKHYNSPEAAKEAAHLEMSLAVQAVDYDKLDSVPWNTAAEAILKGNHDKVDDGTNDPAAK